MLVMECFWQFWNWYNQNLQYLLTVIVDLVMLRRFVRISKEVEKTAGNVMVAEFQFNKVQDNTDWKRHANLLLHILNYFKLLLWMKCNLSLFSSVYPPRQPNHCWLHLMVPELSKSLNNLLNKFTEFTEMPDVLSNYSIINNLRRIINDLMACLSSTKYKVIIQYWSFI